ncbi:RWD domain-containing protein [Paraphysoderma sedebokerense]|nr:RWD domain-containing protein [Paraphysoderma sedebokerense]
MDDYETEQATEIEVLKSIYFTEFIEIDESNPKHFAIEIKPDEEVFDPLPEDEREICLSECVYYLSVTYTPTYPSTLPEITLSLSHPVTEEIPSEPESHYLTPTETTLASLQNHLVTLVQEHANMGVIIFNITSALKEHLSSSIRSQIKYHEDEKERKRIKEEEEEMRKFQGSRVTAESFWEWKQKFDQEMKAIEAAKEKEEGGLAAARAKAAKVKLTGKQLFEMDKSLMESDANFGIGEDEDSVDPSLFERELENLDISDSEDENDEVAKMLLGAGED